MKSTNYYIVHKSGRKLKVSCVGYMHSKDMRQSMIVQVAKVEHHRPKDYRVEEEKVIEKEGAFSL